jgi:hypothetical protein
MGAGWRATSYNASRSIQREASTSFLKKRSKKLLVHETVPMKPPMAQNNKSFLVTFFQKSNCFLPISLKPIILLPPWRRG